MNAIEIYMVIVAAVGFLAAGTMWMYAEEKFREAKQWKRRYERLVRERER